MKVVKVKFQRFESDENGVLVAIGITETGETDRLIVEREYMREGIQRSGWLITTK